MRSSSLAAIASRQHGLLSRAQLRVAGWNRPRIEHAVRRWQIVLPEVYLVTDSEVNHDVRAAAALLRWPDALLSHTSSAYFLGWPVLDELPAWPKWLPREHWPKEPELHVTCSRRLRAPEGIVAHQSPPGPAIFVRDVRVTDHVRTLLDVARTAPLPISLPIIDAALHQQPWLLEPLKAEANCRGGERGISRAQRAIHLASPEAESPLETLLRLLILLAGLPAPDTQVEVRTPRKTYYADLGYREQRLLLEADSRKHHSEWKKVSDDMVRHNAMVGAGWRVLRFTWSQIMYQPELVIAAIRQALYGDVALAG
jgi:very-short-patch-repair endonuclease